MTNWNDILKNSTTDSNKPRKIKEGKALILEVLEDLKEDISTERLKSEESVEMHGDLRAAKGFRADVDSRLANIVDYVNRKIP